MFNKKHAFKTIISNFLTFFKYLTWEIFLQLTDILNNIYIH